jgi:fucose 4-O-acetylase-like acetyltransferase
MEKMRDATFDMLKGIGILLVIIGHTFMKEIGPYIQAFHMPLFFMVAGYFFKYKPVKDQVIRDFRRLISTLFVCRNYNDVDCFCKGLQGNRRDRPTLGNIV